MAQKAATFGMSSFSDVTRGVQNAAAGMTAVAQANTGLAMRYQAIWREAFQLAYQATQARTESMTRLMSARSPQQLLDANVDLLKGEMQRFLDGQARLSQLSAEAALDAKQRIEEATSALKQGEDAAPGKGREGRRAICRTRSGPRLIDERSAKQSAAAGHTRPAAAQARACGMLSNRRRLG